MSHFVLVDTDVVSYLFKRHSKAGAYRRLLRGRNWAISVQTFAELQYWTLRAGFGESRCQELAEFIETRFHVETTTRGQAIWWARVRRLLEERGLAIAPGDAWVAACA